MFSPQIEAIVFSIFQIFFATRAVLKIGEYYRIFPSFGWGIFGYVTCLDQPHASKNIWWNLINNYSPKWRWLAVDIYRAANRRGKYWTLATDNEVNSCFSILKQWDNILDDFFTCHGCEPGRHFLLSCSEVDSTGYSEFDKRSCLTLSTVLVSTNLGYAQLWNIRSSNVFRPIARQRKY